MDDDVVARMTQEHADEVEQRDEANMPTSIAMIDKYANDLFNEVCVQREQQSSEARACRPCPRWSESRGVSVWCNGRRAGASGLGCFRS